MEGNRRHSLRRGPPRSSPDASTTIEKIGVGTYRGDWTSGHRKLRVSATEESLGSDTPAREVTTQYSLVLEPIASR